MRTTARRFACALLLLASLLLLLPGTAQAQTIVWTREFGTTRYDIAFDAAADSTGVYVVGETDGNLGDQQQHGGGDAFIRRYSGGGASAGRGRSRTRRTTPRTRWRSRGPTS